MDAYHSGESQVEAYEKLVAGHPCSPEDQAGEDAKVCPTCDRRTVHQYAHVCMVCGAEPEESAGDDVVPGTPSEADISAALSVLDGLRSLELMADALGLHIYIDHHPRGSWVVSVGEHNSRKCLAYDDDIERTVVLAVVEARGSRISAAPAEALARDSSTAWCGPMAKALGAKP